MFQKPSEQILKKKLTPLQYAVTQQSHTEKQFDNQYFDCKKVGVYKCVVCEKPLFSSDYKYDSGSGWPAFYKEIQSANISKTVQEQGTIELKCGSCDGHLGHLFGDGPKEEGQLRYCVNSASLSFQQKL